MCLTDTALPHVRAHSSSAAIIPTAKRGFNLVEAAIVLGVIGLVIGGIWVAAASATKSLNISNTARNIILVATEAARVFPLSLNSAPPGSDGCSGAMVDLTATAITSGIVPGQWVNGNGLKPEVGTAAYITQWGDGVMGGTSANYSIAGAISIGIDGLTYEECRRLLPSIIAGSKSGLIIYIDVGTNETPGSGVCDWGSSVSTYDADNMQNAPDSCVNAATNKIHIVFSSTR